MARKNIFDDSLVFSLASALAVVSTSVLNFYIVVRFGANYQADAFFVAYTVPGILTAAMLSAMQVVLVPTFVHLGETYGSIEGGKRITWLGVVGLLVWSGVALVGMVCGPSLIKVFTPSVALVVQQIAAQISRWIFFVVPLTWLAGFFQSLLNSQRRFIIPLISESLANMLAVSILLIRGESVTVIAVSVIFVIKVVVQVLFSLLGLWWHIKAHEVFTSISAERADIGATFWGFSLRFGAALARQSNVTFERFWAANLATGTVSALSYAQMTVNMLSKVFSASVATVLLPSLSETTSKETNGQESISVDILRLSLFLTMPIAAFGMIFSYPVSRIALVFSGTYGDLIRLTARLLSVNVWQVPLIALLSVLLAPFYAVEDIKTPVNHMFLMLGVNLILDVLLFPVLGVYGFPFAAVLTDLISVLRAFWLQKRLDSRLAFASILDLRHGLVGLMASVGVAMVIAWLLLHLLLQLIGASVWGQIFSLGLALLGGGSIYFVVIWLIKLPEAAYIVTILNTLRAKVIKRL